MRTILCLAILASTAVAGNGTGVVVTGESTLQPQLAAQLETWLAEHGHPLVSSPLPPDAISTLIDCFVIEDESCARAIVEKRAKADTIVFARIEVSPGTDGMRDVMLVAYWFEKGYAAISDKRFCEHCTEQSLRGTANELVAALAKAGARGQGRLNVTSDPSNARVTCDGKPIGATPIDHEITAGPHTITVEHDGHAPETRNIAMRDGETTRVDVALTPVEKPPSKIVPIAVAGAGAIALVGGIVLQATVSSPPVGEDQPASLVSAPGIALVVVGSAAIAVGAYLWMRATQQQTSVASAPILAPTAGGAVFGWAHRF